MDIFQVYRQTKGGLPARGVGGKTALLKSAARFVGVLLLAPLLAGCGGDLFGSGGVPDSTSVGLTVLAELAGPEYTYPLQDAVVSVDGEEKQTGRTGKVGFSSVPKERDVELTIRTDFASATQTHPLSANTTWSVPLNLPELVSDDEFINSIFRDGSINYRLERGTTIYVYFDYSGAPNMGEADRLAAEYAAEREFLSWFGETSGDNPNLRWGGFVDSEEEANIIVYMLHDEAFWEVFPGDRPSEGERPTVAGRGGPRGYQDGYTTHGLIWIRVDCCALVEGIYAHELGHAIGFGHPGDLGSDRSVMGYNHRPRMLATDVDRAMLQVKMHLPPGIEYDAERPAMRAWGDPEPLPTYVW